MWTLLCKVMALCVSCLLILNGCAIQPSLHQPVVEPEEFSQVVAQLRVGDVVSIEKHDGEKFDLLISVVSDTSLEGEATSWLSGAQWWPVHLDIDDIKTINGVESSAVKRAASEETTKYDAPDPVQTPENDLEKPDDTESLPGIVTVASPDEAVQDSRYASLTSNLNKGDVVDVVMHSGETFSVEIQSIGATYISGYRVFVTGGGDTAFPDQYALKEIRSINGVYAPIDFSRYDVGDRVEVLTVNDEVVRVKITRIDPELIAGTVMDDNEPRLEKGSMVEIRREIHG